MASLELAKTLSALKILAESEHSSDRMCVQMFCIARSIRNARRSSFHLVTPMVAMMKSRIGCFAGENRVGGLGPSRAARIFPSVGDKIVGRNAIFPMEKCSRKLFSGVFGGVLADLSFREVKDEGKIEGSTDATPDKSRDFVRSWKNSYLAIFPSIAENSAGRSDGCLQKRLAVEEVARTSRLGPHTAIMQSNQTTEALS